MLMKADGGGQAQLKRANRMALIRQLRVQPGRSRVELAQALGLTKSTVSTLVRELVDEGWLMEREVLVTGDVGRRPTPLFVDPGRLLLLGIAVDHGGVRVALASLSGDVLAARSTAYDPDLGARGCIDSLARALLDITAGLGASQRIIGIGAGLPGGVDESRGHLVYAHNLGWHDVPFSGLLAHALEGTPLARVPVFVQNDADVAALGETEFNPAPGGDPLLFAYIGEGVGAGVIVGGRLLIGARGFAGEVGHMVLQLDGPRCSCGRQGCVEALIGSRALRRDSGVDEAPASASLDPVRALLAAGDSRTTAAVTMAGRYVGVLLQNLAAAYDPACIVLGGPVVDLGEALLAPARDALQGYARAAQVPEPVLRVSRFGPDAIAIGAAALAGYRLTQPAL
ncbi:ROK family transcriptional regulator [Roseateles cellulosilyticus]|uniref:ROK family transcriptional regulator n=1 Tax=Pelomonas cellulosilytica TaxID=2906762 RepID=A0ABS8XQP4_9BURK|nr:ROK family transcriptional regulator [Pelomonas sp. P8]MCE4553063.1 ROK family transcriptional regulator [Pelomonas sp. P8]